METATKKPRTAEEYEAERKKYKDMSHLCPEALSHYCYLVGQRLLRLAVKHALDETTTMDPRPLLIDWELNMRIPIETGEAKELEPAEKVFRQMVEMNKLLD